MDEALLESLQAAGKPAQVYRSPDGSEVLVLPYGGRILGLYAPGGRENFLWTNAALSSPETARAFYRSGKWHNSGGDRTWLAPEADFFLPDFPSLERYWQPRELDPGHYDVVRAEDGAPRLVNRLTCVLSRSKRAVDLEIVKSVAPALNPLRYERAAAEWNALEYAGYTLRTSLSVMGEAPPSAIGAWNLLQMPHGGDMLAPVYSKLPPKVIFGEIPAGDLTAGDRLIRYRMRSAGDHKISLRAVATAGRVGYICPSGRRWALIVRNFFINPSGEYADFPWTDPGDLGYSVQACNVNNPALGAFSELEYHVPAVGPGTGRARCDDESVVWAFRGPGELIQKAAGMLLSPEAEVPS
jgi:hypothetical protein